MKIVSVKLSEILKEPNMPLDAKYWVNKKAKERKIFIIKYREGRKEGEIWGASLDKDRLIKAFAKENRDDEYFKNYTDNEIFETIEKSGEFEMVISKYF